MILTAVSRRRYQSICLLRQSEFIQKGSPMFLCKTLHESSGKSKTDQRDNWLSLISCRCCSLNTQFGQLSGRAFSINTKMRVFNGP